jgi:hydrogenase maturation protease
MADGSLAAPGRTTVIGLGNPLMGDDGLGIVAVERLQARYELPATVEVVDGGTWGMRLLPAIEDAESLLLIDAIDLDKPPGTEVTLGREELPRTFFHKLSPHQIDVGEVLALCEVRGRLPRQAIAIGVQPEHVAFGAPLSDTVASRVDAVVGSVVRQLAAWGHAVTRIEAVAAASAELSSDLRPPTSDLVCTS